MCDGSDQLSPPSPALLASHTGRQDVCRCSDHPATLLQSTLEWPPLACARCNLGMRPESHIVDSHLLGELRAWQSVHDALYLLWLDSAEYEPWARDRLLDPHGEVNVLGLKLAARLGASSPCFLWWFCDDSTTVRPESAQCPRCRGSLETAFSGERPSGGSLLVCHACSIALGI